MAIANKTVDQNQISIEEFKKWLKKFDADRDGRISVEELRTAIRASGGWWFCTRKAKRGVKMADKNLNGVVDDYEINNLVEFAHKYLGLRVTSN
ncbi:hypothetical protein C2S52_022944 [Perilla frutescens var. hirtella]|uniref:EF-hand domain-containing protein n=1 Tax=Perilla frutescens var. hirtella TaxID=608512 RepID=A0AAD4P6P6_PERFH|nr:hypothetical protein C2S52_022944 [Perilla frutescens var. hirtella]KAH6782341.1 hypothetical protein C2S51_007634 [Perilla frutescens var. frutescens]KAH6828969.1 hypothetical protein C2S53_012366 [Perilla frutescens var. hirtella]